MATNETENNNIDNKDINMDNVNTEIKTENTPINLNKDIEESVNLNKNNNDIPYNVPYGSQSDTQYNNINQQNNDINQQQYGFNNQNTYSKEQLDYITRHDKSIPETPEDKAKADKLCKITLLLLFGPQVISLLAVSGFYALSLIFGFDTNSFMESYESNNLIGNIFGVIYGFISLLGQAAGIGSFITMIYVRVKYPKNTFGKVLMWLYIAFIATAIIALFVIVAACMTALKDCPG